MHNNVDRFTIRLLVLLLLPVITGGVFALGAIANGHAPIVPSLGGLLIGCILAPIITMFCIRDRA